MDSTVWLIPLPGLVPTTRLLLMTWLALTIELVPLVGFFPDPIRLEGFLRLGSYDWTYLSQCIHCIGFCIEYCSWFCWSDSYQRMGPNWLNYTTLLVPGGGGGGRFLVRLDWYTTEIWESFCFISPRHGYCNSNLPRHADKPHPCHSQL